MGKKREVSAGTVLKSGIWYTVSSICIRAIGIISSPIYTRMLTTADYGMANTYNSWVSLMNIFTCLCLVSCVGRAKLDFSNEYDAFLSSAQALSSGAALVILGIVYVFLDPVSSLMGYSKGLILLLFVYLIFSPSVDYMQNKYRFQYKYYDFLFILCRNCFLVHCFYACICRGEICGKNIGNPPSYFSHGPLFLLENMEGGKGAF